MRKRVLAKNLRRTIQGSFARYLAIVIIIALGSAMFVGLISTKTDMVATGQKYMDAQNMFDLRLLSTYGWTQAEVDAVSKMEGVEFAEGSVSLDVIGDQWSGETDSVYKVHSMPKLVSQVYLLGGRWPESPDECLIDGHYVGDEVLGREFVVSQDNASDTLDALVYDSYTIVGYVSSPLYMDMSRGSTSIGNGNVSGYVYIPAEGMALDYYTEIGVTLEGDYVIYSETYNKVMEDMADRLKPGVTLLANDRFGHLKVDAEREYDAGKKEYDDGVRDYEAGKAEALTALEDALRELQDGQRQIDANRALLEQGMAELLAGQAEIDEQRATLEAGMLELAGQRAQAYLAMAEAHATLTENYRTVTDSLRQVNNGIAQIDAGLLQINEGIVQIQDGLTQVEEGLEQLRLVMSLKSAQVDLLFSLLDSAQQSPYPDKELISRLDAEYVAAKAELDEYWDQMRMAMQMQTELTQQLETLQAQMPELEAQRAELVVTRQTLQEALDAINAGFLELDSNRLLAESQFAQAESQLKNGEKLLELAQKELDAGRAELESGMEQLNQAQVELDAGMEEYEAGRAETMAQLEEAKLQLDDAALKLEDARQTIDSMADAEVYILDRNTNVGYLALDNNSDIVAGVSRVFPAFFLLVAALVCITTMTRMVEEERTQIGTFKALGYRNGAIVRKYLVYAGSAAIVGCGLGVTLGSIIFPTILWDIYGLLLNLMPNVVLKVNWPLCIAVVSAYSVVMLFVTWYCCRIALREAPAELIRPKSPTSGKKILLEYVPFWKKIGFLNKVMLRNVFRYRQRILMMFVGIGGCTALLLTGYGLRDSIVNIAADQFKNVTIYDMQIYFANGQSQQEQDAFREELKKEVEGIHFYHQASVDLNFGSNTSELYMIVSDEGIKNYIVFERNGEEVKLPGVNEVVLTIGVAERMGVSVGDVVTLRNADMRELEVTVSGIFDNQVNNYAFVNPLTVEAQWGSVPASQMAVVNTRHYVDVHEVGAHVAGRSDVLNVSLSVDMAQQVGSMLQALDTVVVIVVVCAGALAFTVLYNLTNINITERIREIATIKVLGFRAGESAAYVFKENLMLTAMSMIFGLFLGKWLLDFVISQVKVDMIWLITRIQPMSCVYAVCLTMLSAVIVDVVLYFKLDKINMAEALKSVE